MNHYKINVCFIEASRMHVLKIDCGIYISDYSNIIVWKTLFYCNFYFYFSEEKFEIGYFYVLNNLKK